jgi:hypothetical protein
MNGRANPDAARGSGTSDDNAKRWIGVLRAHWELMTALATMVGVLAVLEVVSLGRPELVLSCGPVCFLALSALVRVGPAAVASCAVLFVAAALAAGDWRYAALCYPAAVLAALAVLQRLLRGPR